MLAQAGHLVHGVDLSRWMLAVAKEKAAAAGVEVDFRVGDAADPPCGPGSYDVVLVRHVL
ncbi:class I SAM-dependent methyltransferase [Amycolatopsis sp. CA-128772]|uniref:class I SAM-dependent methyltransferase n=1 Tax=Amycolatopsis sp. CA-128772 TaxID=2073159 RepID=UPI001E4798B3|nr:class I SAM-dependent methyltransferase [Amycolatopsis sp. CA-128772]